MLWRTLRLVRTQMRWERRALAFRLQELAFWRAVHPALTAARLNQLRSDLDLVTTDVIRQGSRLRKHFEALWTALFDPERWQRLADHIRDPSHFPNEPAYMAPSPSLMNLLWARIAGGSRRGGAGLPPASKRRAGKRPAPPKKGAERPPCAPRNSFNRRFDPLQYLCRTRSRGVQDWRLRLDRLTAETLSLPFRSPSEVERGLERQAAPAPASEARPEGEGRGRRRRHSRSKQVFGVRAWDPWARDPADLVLGDLAQAGKLVDINSLSVLRELLAQGLASGDSGQPGITAAADVRKSGEELAALAEALWTRIEGFRVLVETLQELLTRMLEYHGCSGGVLTAANLGKTAERTAVRTPPLPSEAPRFEAILKSRKTASVASRAAGEGPERSAAGLRLDDLRISLGPFLPDATPLDGFRQWFEAADGVLGAGSRLAQSVDVALYEFAVRQFGIRREFVAWRPELGLDQWRERQGRPEWAVQVETVDGEVLVRVDDEEVRKSSD